MFADPAVVTINGSNKSLVRINQDRYSSEYLHRTATEEYRMIVRNNTRTDRARAVKVDRHNVELTHTVFPVAPSTRSYIRKTYVVIENEQGDTLTDPQYVASGLFAYLTAANITKLENFES
jgi:hypothetical protein